MNLKVHRERLGFNLDTVGFVVDILMIILVIINLAWIAFDALFAYQWFVDILAAGAPELTRLYAQTLHENFFWYDLWFVAVFLTEFMIRWVIAIARRSYHRWFFFPFVHWYDLLGCIPIGGFRWLRLLRVISLLHRLQRNGVIDLADTKPGRFFLKYYGALVEEVSDRVVINVLEGVQRELREDNPLSQRIERKVLAPRRSALVDYLAERIISAAEQTHRQYREPMGQYLATLSEKALARTRSGARLAAIPGVGPRTLALLRETVQEMGVALSDQLVEDLTNPRYRAEVDRLLDDLLDSVVSDRDQIDSLVRDTLLEILDEVKAQVAVQQWKLRGNAPTGF